MYAIDTHVVVRYLTGDHPQQSARARRLIDRNEVFVSTTVMLECEWVLRAVYRHQQTDVCAALRRFSGLPGVALEDANLVAVALARASVGMDFADALHLGRAAQCDVLLTFDRKFIKEAKAAGIDTVRAP
jgi:predicted nucleic-acid-binding protein